ncbi:MAG: hypothetical protein GXO79_15230 [Chlorobi bacterium]|nr:hypothetical protein [Chlorobiota bacterium]
MHKIAELKGGCCLSDTYKNQKIKLLWQCKNGHKWWAQPDSLIHQNSWCPVCAGNKKLTIEEMVELANKKGGKCLSQKYINSKSKLLWECKIGHRWFTSAFSIKVRNSWCPVCNKYSFNHLKN